jgi:pimeloyl-ACP methyl ester carboxylesterase
MKNGFAPVDGARLYYEVDGSGPSIVMIHAGVADSRQWNNEFQWLAEAARVVRYDLRGYGQSEPVAGDFTHLRDLLGLLDHVEVPRPVVAIGCSMGGTLAMDYALERPAEVRALVMVGSGPSGLELDVPPLPKFADVEKAFTAGDLDLACELETQIWFDGVGRTPAQVDRTMRRLAYDMNRLALAHDAQNLGRRRKDAEVPAAGRLGDVRVPVLIVVGEHDVPFIHWAADYMAERLPSATRVRIADAAHLPNMDQPDEFRRVLSAFLDRHVNA